MGRPDHTRLRCQAGVQWLSQPLGPARTAAVTQPHPNKHTALASPPACPRALTSGPYCATQSSEIVCTHMTSTFTRCDCGRHKEGRKGRRERLKHRQSAECSARQSEKPQIACSQQSKTKGPLLPAPIPVALLRCTTRQPPPQSQPGLPPRPGKRDPAAPRPHSRSIRWVRTCPRSPRMLRRH